MTDTIAFKPVGAHALAGPRHAVAVIAGTPNSGKTTLFNALTGIRAKTANFPGTTVEIRKGRMLGEGHALTLIDLPGLYSFDASTPDEHVARDVLLSEDRPEAVIAVVDATRLERNLPLASHFMELDVPVIVALTMMDVVRRRRIAIHVEELEQELGCPVIPVSARTGEGLQELRHAVAQAAGTEPKPEIARCVACRGCPLPARYRWSEDLCNRCVRQPAGTGARHTDRLDSILAHPVLGLIVFAAVMTTMFFLIFHAAESPMAWIEHLFSSAAEWIEGHLPDNWFTRLLAGGVVAGVGGVLVFLPQIAMLFFALSLLEDTGYLARAAMVMDRWMQRVGLPGKAFVPLLSAHACAIPAIMATRVMEQPRDRLITILVAPLLSCSARLPVYIMIAGLLAPGDALASALLLSGAYLTGLGAALGAAFLFRRTILPGPHQPLLIELPDYRRPGLRTAFWYTWDRIVVFLQQAGSLILLFSIIMWFLASFPESPAGPAPEDSATGMEHTYAGRMGRFIEPVIRPLGFDWQIGVGVISSFAAREVLIATLAIIYGIEDADEDHATFMDTMRRSTRRDGSPVFTTATCMSLLVFYILAAQCIPTQIITRRETGSWKWAALQFSYMNLLAYAAAFLTYQGIRLLGG